MELLMRALEIAVRAEQLPFGLGWKGNVHGGCGGAPANVDQCVGQHCTHGLGCSSGPHQKSAAGYRREWNGNLQLWIVASTGALIGFGPAVIEDIFAARMRFRVAGNRAEKLVMLIRGEEVHWLPPGPRAHRI